MLVEERSCLSAPTPKTSVRRVAAPAAGAESGAGAMSLVVTEGESPGRRVAIGPAPIVIGRGLGVDLQIRDPTVSRHHCVVWCTSGRCWVRDLGSTNQTRVNNRCSIVTEIFAGDVLVVGQTALTLAVADQFAEVGPVSIRLEPGP